MSLTLAVLDVSVLGVTQTVSPEKDAKCRAYNDKLRASNMFDGLVDFYTATVDPESHAMKAMFVPESTTGGAGDKLHPNRAGHLATGSAIDLKMLMGQE